MTTLADLLKKHSGAKTVSILHTTHLREEDGTRDGKIIGVVSEEWITCMKAGKGKTLRLNDEVVVDKGQEYTIVYESKGKSAGTYKA